MTSASTLIRMAAKAKNPKEAKRLRAEAAELRRQARQAKKPRPMTGFPGSRQIAEGIAANARNVATTAIGADPNANRASGGPVNAAQPMLQLDPLSQRAEYLYDQLQVMKKDQHKSKIRLRAELLDAKMLGKKEAEAAHVNQLKQIHEANAINVVCAFVAAAEGWAKINGGTMPKYAVVAGQTVMHLVEALQNAGYSAEGLKSMSRFAADQRLTR